jgi:hypothetical protein
MNVKNAFPLELDFEGHHYKGTIIPSEDTAPDGVPVYFRIMLGDKFYAYLCCGDNGWREREKEGHPPGLVQAIGDYIADYYE